MQMQMLVHMSIPSRIRFCIHTPPAPVKQSTQVQTSCGRTAQDGTFSAARLSDNIGGALLALEVWLRWGLEDASSENGERLTRDFYGGSRLPLED